MQVKRIWWMALFFISVLAKAERGYIFEHLSTESGLSHSSVSVMLKDYRGFMWFATWDGVNRFDGENFVAFKPDNGDGSVIASNRIEKMKEDAFGNIWVVTADFRAFRLNKFTEQFEPIPSTKCETDPVQVDDFYFTSLGDVWVLTRSFGAYRVVTHPVTNQTTTTHFNSQHESGAVGSHIYFVHEDAANNVWVGSNQGIVSFQTRNLSGDIAVKQLSDEVKMLFLSHEIGATYSTLSHIYFGTQAGYLLAFDVVHETLNLIAIDGESAITHITGNEAGTLFVGTKNNGLFTVDEESQQRVHHYNHPSVQHILKTFYFNERLWVETTEAGISKIDLTSQKVRRYIQQLDVSLDVRAYAQCGLMVDEKQTLWLTLKGGGFGFYDETTDEVMYFFNQPNDPQQKVSNFVNCFYKDSTGVLWMSTYFKGIEKITFSERYFKWIEPAPQMDLSTSNEIRAMLEDRYGLLWVATKNQEVFLLDEEFRVVKSFTHFNGAPIGRVYALLEDAHGNIFLGTKGNGLYRLLRQGKEEFTVTHYLHQPTDLNSISDNNIYAILEDKVGAIWVGTFGGGINIFKNNQFYHADNGLKNYPKDAAKKVRHLIQDQSGLVWIASTEGLLLVDSISDQVSSIPFKLYNRESLTATGMRSNDIFWLLNDAQNNIWMASLGGGLAQLNRAAFNQDKRIEFLTFTKKEGLSSDIVFTMMSDDEGAIWMSTENGISSFLPSTRTFKNYQQLDGTLHPIFSEGASAVRRNGAFCFGANNGLYSFYPSSFKIEKKRTDIVFTGFQLFGKEITPADSSILERSISQTESVTLKHHQNIFSISWAGLDFNAQNRMHYACKLEGYDIDWRELEERTSEDYHQIPPGDYTFYVKFTNPELSELSPMAQLSIKILPPFWKTHWAYVLYFVLLIIMVELARRVITTVIKLRNKVEIEKGVTEAKLSFFTNISHELRTPLTLMLGPLTEIRQKERLTKKGEVYAQLIETNAERLLRLVNQLLDFRKVQSGNVTLNLHEVDLVTFLQSVCIDFNEEAAQRQINFAFETQLTYLGLPIDEEKLESVVINLLSNAFKFTSNSGTIKVVLLQPSADEVVIEVVDNGVGISKEQEVQLFEMFSSHYPENLATTKGSGIGLALAKELVQALEGELSYHPTVGGGATFSIHLFPNLLSSLVADAAEDKSKERALSTLHEEVLTQEPVLPSSFKILVVDDNIELRGFLQLQLSGGYEVFEAQDGVDGLQKALEIQPDVILSDVMMPKMDGIELLEAIKNNFETSHIPVVLLTAKSSVESRIEGLKHGADAYLTKPFNSQELKLQMRNILNNRRLIAERFMQQGVAQPDVEVEGVTKKDVLFLNQVRQIIEANLTNSDFKLEDIYKEVGMGRSKFSHKINGLTGLSPINFVNEYKLTKAQKLLRTGQHNVSEVSFLSGFSDAGYFSKCFKERFGVAPSHYISTQN